MKVECAKKDTCNGIDLSSYHNPNRNRNSCDVSDYHRRRELVDAWWLKTYLDKWKVAATLGASGKLSSVSLANNWPSESPSITSMVARWCFLPKGIATEWRDDSGVWALKMGNVWLSSSSPPHCEMQTSEEIKERKKRRLAFTFRRHSAGKWRRLIKNPYPDGNSFG